MIWRSGVDARCDYFNKTWLAFTGRRIEQEMGDGWIDGVHRDDQDRCVSHYRDHFRRREPFEMEYRLRRHDGSYRWIFDRGVPFSEENGDFAGFIFDLVSNAGTLRVPASNSLTIAGSLTPDRIGEMGDLGGAGGDGAVVGEWIHPYRCPERPERAAPQAPRRLRSRSRR